MLSSRLSEKDKKLESTGIKRSNKEPCADVKVFDDGRVLYIERSLDEVDMMRWYSM
ncbi:hypothetical protein M413DRAFT_81905 [Hebeloma cylindrosporum]|uniref:Uncharacterized protein n=1 Tax=Hebeloma cylindrosporum TaxID=76867 RepID=A0A0C3CIV6_HEBCY|nr:hypothetical protein M413DRAFT_81905 [Hebeloma cylindrosporum h7]